ncbi:MBL fold metallo-hydrolase [Cytophagales bacterium LB-30]|uniref:MBL fold metallo-hydrolase n=1 Tax=Shiella aurantiaca TaxID=3058365 RepID=A0ABT8F492_9BACT|nr:MBL fold metallo-hydrolase [Shiella aurantiaca]MDN4164811.1 MBL fold metallo-hydrolase [Shiella aurantiaca]
MKLEQIYTGCLAQGAYYIESKGEAVIIDPLRETAPYVKKLADEGATLKYIFETHFHADFVSGHVDLAKETGAKIVFGPTATTGYDAHIATDGEVFAIGDIKLKVLHTPGHTMESTTFLLIDEKGKEHAIFSGDTLFIGDVGRPDLAIKSNVTKEDLAGMLFDSLRNKIMTLPDEVLVYPAHGAGSACGKNMSKETWDTLGNQKKTNYALRADMSKEEFIKEVTTGILPPPYYFAKNAMMNKSGYENVNTVINKGMTPLSPADFEAVVEAEGALVLDTRSPQEFEKGFVPRAINIGLNGDFAPWVGNLITDIKHPIVLVTEEGKEEDSVKRLARVGYDNTLGFLKGGVAAWAAAGKELDTVTTLTAQDLADLSKKENIHIVDVRKPSEWEAEHLEKAVGLPLNFITENWDDYEKDKTNYIHCAGGYRSMIAASILKSRGYHNVVNIAGGFKAIAETDMPKTSYVCPSTLKA